MIACSGCGLRYERPPPRRLPPVPQPGNVKEVVAAVVARPRPQPPIYDRYTEGDQVVGECCACGWAVVQFELYPRDENWEEPEEEEP